MTGMRYIELFSGIGAFSQAIENVVGRSAKCVFAADIDDLCVKVYKQNYGIDSKCDITKQDETAIPEHDFCFFSPPCQAFSKSGKRLGFEETRGTLIFDVFRILKHHRPRYILMENVRNLVSHDHGNTIRVIMDTLRDMGYCIPKEPLILSPHFFGSPQTRERAFLPGIYSPEHSKEHLQIALPEFLKKEDNSVYDILDENESDDSLQLTEKEKRVMRIWDEFYQNIDLKVIGFPVWADYFMDSSSLSDYPGWKAAFIIKNRELYARNREFIDDWILRHDIYNTLNPTQRKFEWQAGTKIKTLYDGIIQFRPSGMRVKTPCITPALVAMVQIPIIGKLQRRMSVRECARLQAFPDTFDFCNCSPHDSYKQLGNSINVRVLEHVIKGLLDVRLKHNPRSKRLQQLCFAFNEQSLLSE